MNNLTKYTPFCSMKQPTLLDFLYPSIISHQSVKYKPWHEMHCVMAVNKSRRLGRIHHQTAVGDNITREINNVVRQRQEQPVNAGKVIRRSRRIV